jgi:signal transduction histidine kinase
MRRPGTRLGDIRRAALATGLLALGVAVALSLWTQYRWLVRVSETYPQAYREAMGSRLSSVSDDIATRLETDLLRALDGPPEAIVAYSEDDDVERYFAGAPDSVAERYFLFAFLPERQLKVTVYDPEQRMKTREWDSYSNVARNASLKWMYALASRAVVDPRTLEVFEANPERLVISRAVVDESSRAVGVAGLVVHPRVVRDVAIPSALAAALRERQDGDFEGVSLAIVDADDAVVHAPSGDVPGGAPVASAQLGFPFPQWRLAAYSLGPTPEAEAMRQFWWGAAQVALVGLLLVAGLGLAVRASAQEMRALRLKADFVSNITHELQSPLTSIKLHAELLRTNRLSAPDEIAECGTYIERDAERLSRLVNNVLDFGRIDAGRKTYRFREVDLVDVVTGVVDELYTRIERADLFVDFDAPAAALPAAVADRAAVEQVVANLLDNAVKWSPAGGRIVIRCGARPGRVWVSVADFGPGIPAEEHERIFERFYRVETGLRHDVPGSGIGLALVKHVVDAHRGRVDVTSEPGRGSTFTVELPAADGPAWSEFRGWEESDDKAVDRRG